MKIFVTSDTHGDLSKVTEMYDLITGDTPEGIPHVDKFDVMIHCGDLKPDAFDLRNVTGLETYSVFGNCDGVLERDFDTLETPAGRALIIHGHTEDVNTDHRGLIRLAKELKCRIAVYGHTHVPVFREEDGIFIVNPGSPSRPLDGTDGSCAVLICDESGISGGIVYYADISSKDDTKKRSGGFLRKIFNYSDGQ